jgi:hypothetical protein
VCGVAKTVGSALGVEVFTPVHFYLAFTLMVFMAYFATSTLLSFVF